MTGNCSTHCGWLRLPTTTQRAVRQWADESLGVRGAKSRFAGFERRACRCSEAVFACFQENTWRWTGPWVGKVLDGFSRDSSLSDAGSLAEVGRMSTLVASSGGSPLRMSELAFGSDVVGHDRFGIDGEPAMGRVHCATLVRWQHAVGGSEGGVLMASAALDCLDRRPGLPGRRDGHGRFSDRRVG